MPRCISLMKDSAVVVNTSRGAVIDTLALAEALQADILWGAGIDVFEGEPDRSRSSADESSSYGAQSACGVLV